MNIRQFAHICRAFMKKEDGNFAMLAATLIPLTFAAGSFAVDFASIISMKTRLQNAADGAALATSSQLAQKLIAQADAKEYAENFFRGAVSEDANAFSAFSATPTATITAIPNGPATIWKVEVKSVGTQQLTPMAAMVGQDKVDVTVTGVSQSSSETTNPLSMYLVLDHSGSMAWDSGQTTTVEYEDWCWSRWQGWYRCKRSYTQAIPKIDVLKSAVKDLVADIKESDPEDKYSRMGAVSYNSATYETDKLAADWSKDRVTTFTNALVATGGTNSWNAMKWAYEKVTASTEVNAHFSKNGSNKPSKFIVFMTDGENDTGSSSGNDYADKQTEYYCTQAKDKDVTIFTVAFQAPDRGKKLLQACASSLTYYYDANSADELIAAFKEIGEQATKLSNRLTM